MRTAESAVSDGWVSPGCLRTLRINFVQPPHFGVEENEAGVGESIPLGPGSPAGSPLPSPTLFRAQSCYSERPQLLLVCRLITLHLVWERTDQISPTVGN